MEMGDQSLSERLNRVTKSMVLVVETRHQKERREKKECEDAEATANSGVVLHSATDVPDPSLDDQALCVQPPVEPVQPVKSLAANQLSNRNRSHVPMLKYSKEDLL